jgi:hypothetical protein
MDHTRMDLMRLIVLSFLALVLLVSRASAADLYMKYKLYAVGLPIGSGVLSLDFGDETYSIKGDGKTAAFGRLVSDGNGAAEVRGGVEDGVPQPENYAFRISSEDETGDISMQLSGGKVGRVSVDPPQDRMNERVKVTAKHVEGVLDPLTAAVFPAPKGLVREACNRTLPLFDGKERYNVHLSYKSRRKTSTADGRFKGDVLVCRARYEPIAGHRPKRKAIQDLAKNKSVEVWLAPVGDKPYLVPLRASITVAFGSLVVQAEKFKLTK